MSTIHKSSPDPIFLPISQDKPSLIELRNAGQNMIVYRFKCTHSVQFAVAPAAAGILAPQQRQTFEISPTSGLSLSVENEYFLLLETTLFRPTATGETFKAEKPDAALAWQDAVWSDITRTRIPVKLQSGSTDAKPIMVSVDRNPGFVRKRYMDRIRAIIERIRRENLCCATTCLFATSFGGGFATGIVLRRSRILGIMCSMLILSYALTGVYALNSGSGGKKIKKSS